MTPGAIVTGERVRFRVWAPKPRAIELLIVAPVERRVAMQRLGGDWYEAEVALAPGARYFYLVDGERRRPDPASRAQPDGVHGASAIVDARFAWKHARPSLAIDRYAIYELHVGTFTREGTFDAAARELHRLVELGVTAVELMPVASFPGARNWGYDGVGWYAPQASYGGPDGLRRFVDAAHALGLAAIVDVVYNHLGPEGNYLAEFAPYFTSRRKTPWGDALDWSRPEVRAHAIENARMWIHEYRFDALRVDAVHAIVDDSPKHVVAELAEAAQAMGARVIAESDLGEPRVIEARPRGWGCDAQWSDDLHHALHALATGERHHYYVDFGRASELARALEHGYVYTGERSRFRERPFGAPTKQLPGERFVVFAQNHDQVGNRARGDRLPSLRAGCEHAVAAAYLLAPSVPLVFMGEEHADPAPFLYFTDHQDPALARAVSDGRRREFGWKPDGSGEDVPDPQAPATFERSRIDLSLGERGRHARVRAWYRALLALRRERPSLRALDKSRTDARADDAQATLTLRRWSDDDEVFCAINFGRARAQAIAPRPARGAWRALAESAAFDGPRAAIIINDAQGTATLELEPLAVVVMGAD